MAHTLAISQPGLWNRGVWRFRVLFGDPIPKAELGLFFDRLATLLATGIGIPEALRQASRTSGPELQSICESAIGPTSAGVPLHRAWDPWKRRLPEIVLPVLEVGEVSGTVESASRRLADAFAKGAAVDRRFRYQIFSPGFVIAILVLSTVAHGFPEHYYQLILQGVELLLKLIGLYLGGRLLLRLLFRYQPFRLVVDTIKLAIPHMGTVARKLAAARWGRSFATLWHSGVPISQALEVSSRSALNAHYEQALQKAARSTREGVSLSESLAGTQLLPAYLLDILKTGDATGSFGTVLDRFVGILEEEALTMASQEFMIGVALGQVILAVLVVGALR